MLDLSFRVAALQHEHQSNKHVVSTQVQVPVRDTTWQLKLASPWFVRSIASELPPVVWLEVCKLLKKFGVSVFCPLAKVADLPAAAIPVRFARRQAMVPIDPQELGTADAIELDNQLSTTAGWQWSAEAKEANCLVHFVAAIRQALGSQTPIGVSLPLGAATQDIEACLSAGIDFLTFVVDEQLADIDAAAVQALASVRTRIAQTVGVKIFLVAPISACTTAVTLLALGANCVCIDSLLQPLLQRELNKKSADISGMLSGIATPRQVPFNPAAIQSQLSQLNQELERRMQQTGAKTLAKFDNSCLVGLTDRMCQVAQVAGLV